MKKIDNLKLDVNKNRFINLPAGFKHWDDDERFLNIKKIEIISGGQLGAL